MLSNFHTKFSHIKNNHDFHRLAYIDSTSCQFKYDNIS